LSRRVAALACAAALALAGCGDDELDAAERVAALNEQGAGLALGEQLRSERDGIEIYALELEHPGEVLGEHGAHGSITITPDDETAVDEYERCQAAGALVCFRTANAVLIFEDELEPQDLARIESAIRAAGDG
jgi:hypothetical protein